MFTLSLCLFIACLFTFFTKIPLAVAMAREPGGYDNEHPRTQQAQLTGFGQRALSAHKNSYEALVVFSAAVLLAIATNHQSLLIQDLAIAYVLARVVYHVTYLSGYANLRSLVWAVGYISSLTIIALCIPW